MQEPSHGDILREVGGLKSEVSHLAKTVAALKTSVDEWQAMKAGAGVARWIVGTVLVLLGTVAALFKAIVG